MPAQIGDTVAVQYEGRLEDGSVFEVNREDAPLLFTIGGGDVLPAFEQAVVGLDVGQTVTVTIPPEDAYGPYIEGTRQLVPVDLFGEGEPPLDAHFTVIGDDDEEYTGRVVEITDDRVNVVVDFNHPLAGHSLTFEITLVELHPDEQ